MRSHTALPVTFHYSIATCSALKRKLPQPTGGKATLTLPGKPPDRGAAKDQVYQSQRICGMVNVAL